MQNDNLGYQLKYKRETNVQIIIPSLTRNPIFTWIPAFAGMTSSNFLHNT